MEWVTDSEEEGDSGEWGSVYDGEDGSDEDDEEEYSGDDDDKDEGIESPLSAVI